MSLAAGTRLGPYEVLGLIGAGGMGEVYRARDTRLDRTVAIKVLPQDLAADPDRRSRFEREARTISTLNHPHICTLHDVGEVDGQAFLVMEHLVGETLAERLKNGPLPLAQALTVGTEIADALTAAHRQGFIHRDLKPGNVMLTKSGAKLLDFGLAKLAGHGEQPAAALASAPTRSTPLTGEGVIVGTLQYMAPEQLEGKPTDARTDLWALGAIIYEMLTGKRAFEGTSAASLIGAILEREPAPILDLQPLTPPPLERIVRKCLAKLPDDRWDSAHDLADEMRWIAQSSGALTASQGGANLLGARRARAWQRSRFAACVVAGVLASALLLVWRLNRAAQDAGGSVVSALLDAAPAEGLGEPAYSRLAPVGWVPAFAWTPDGRALVFVGRRGNERYLFVRPLNDPEARLLAGTEGAIMPVVSPDGQWVAFWTRGTIHKVRMSGGPASPLVESSP